MTKLFNVQLKVAVATAVDVSSLDTGDHFKDTTYTSIVHTLLARCVARCLIVSGCLGRYARSQVKDTAEARVNLNKVSLLTYSTKVFKCNAAGNVIKDEVEPTFTGPLKAMERGAIVKCCCVYDGSGSRAPGDYPPANQQGEWFTVCSDPKSYDNQGVFIQSMTTLKVFRASGNVRYCQYKPEDITIKNA